MYGVQLPTLYTDLISCFLNLVSACSPGGISKSPMDEGPTRPIVGLGESRYAPFRYFLYFDLQSPLILLHSNTHLGQL